MPIYEYRCRKCNETFEVIQKVNEDNKGLRCPKCDAGEPGRVLSLFCSTSSSRSTTGIGAPIHSSQGHS
jgi:putative FmdB family regulatory protein